MSFQDLESGVQPSRPAPLGGPRSPQDAAFLQLQSSLSLQVFKINANVQGMLKLVDQVFLLVLLFLDRASNFFFSVGNWERYWSCAQRIVSDIFKRKWRLKGEADCPRVLSIDMISMKQLEIWPSEGLKT